MNVFYKILIMTFLSGAAAGVSLLVLGREIACQAALNANIYISIAAAYAAGAWLAGIFKKQLKKASVTVLNMAISFPAIAAVFYVMAALFFTRFYKVILGLLPEQLPAAPAAAGLVLIVFVPIAFFVFMGITAGEALVENGKAGKPGFVRLMTAAGAAAGMLLYVLFLWRYYKNIDVLYGLGILVLAATYVLFRDKTLEGRWTMLGVITMVIIYLAFNVGGFKEKADRASSRAVYKAYYIVAENEFPTVKFVMAKKGGGLYVFENGRLTYVIPDEKYAEMAKLAQGKKIIVINGGTAGLIEALEKNIKGVSIISYEADPYTAYILENLFKSGAGAASKAVFKTGGITRDAELKKDGFLADAVFINQRPAGSEPYSKQNLEGIKGFMAAGGKLVVSVDADNKAKAKENIKQVFGGAAEEKGFITAVKK